MRIASEHKPSGLLTRLPSPLIIPPSGTHQGKARALGEWTAAGIALNADSRPEDRPHGADRGTSSELPTAHPGTEGDTRMVHSRIPLLGRIPLLLGAWAL